MRTLLAALLLSGCATISGGEPEAYRALGTEPFWSITIANGQMRYETPEGGFSVPAPRGRELGDGRMWETRRITLQASNQQCSDGMSDNRYSQTVRAVVDGRTLNGCGGEVSESGAGASSDAFALNETSWLITEIAGEQTELTGDVMRDDRYAVDFGADRMVGYGGCNRFSGTYRREGNNLVAGPLMSTRRACPEPIMSRERRLFEILRQPVMISFPTPRVMLLTGPAGSIRLRRTI